MIKKGQTPVKKDQKAAEKPKGEFFDKGALAVGKIDYGDVSSASSENSSDDSDIESNEMADSVLIKEQDNKINERLGFTADVYNMTICANMTRCCSPL